MVAESVSRVACIGLLAASAMISLGKPAIDLVFTGGHFSHGDASQCFAYFAVFSISHVSVVGASDILAGLLCGWKHFVPMAAGTVVTLISLPIYFGLFHGLGAMGLAFASDIGIAMQTLADCRSAASAAHGIAGESGLSRDGAVPCIGRSRRRFHLVHIFLGRGHARSHSQRVAGLTWCSVLLGGALWMGISSFVLRQNGIRVAESSDEAAPNRLTRNQSDGKRQ